MEIDVNIELKIIENALRDNILFALEIKYGKNWINELKLSDEIKEKWNKKMIEETKRFNGMIIDTRLLYYSEFHDLHNIIDKHWDDVFKEVFKNKKQIDVLLDIIEAFRISIAHNRELMIFQKNLLKGASGMIRSFMTEYRANRESIDSYYPKFENILVNGLNIIKSDEYVSLTEKVYHVDDEIEVIVNVVCPPDVEVEYAIEITNKELFVFKDEDYNIRNNKIFKLTKKDISNAYLYVAVKSNKEYHRYGMYDLFNMVGINILP